LRGRPPERENTGEERNVEKRRSVGPRSGRRWSKDRRLEASRLCTLLSPSPRRGRVAGFVPDVSTSGRISQGRAWKGRGPPPSLITKWRGGLSRANLARGLFTRGKDGDPLGNPCIQTSPKGWLPSDHPVHATLGIILLALSPVRRSPSSPRLHYPLPSALALNPLDVGVRLGARSRRVRSYDHFIMKSKFRYKYGAL
jgi:hypothetical protein